MIRLFTILPLHPVAAKVHKEDDLLPSSDGHPQRFVCGMRSIPPTSRRWTLVLLMCCTAPVYFKVDWPVFGDIVQHTLDLHNEEEDVEEDK